jgi:predicted dithiol-disulfide oxidoreductase (DUF899 family)
MFAPSVDGWPAAGCPGCSFIVDQIGHLSHLHARDTSFAMVSRAPEVSIQQYKTRMGWRLPWFSSSNSDFNVDFGLTTDAGEAFGLSVFRATIVIMSFAPTSRPTVVSKRSGTPGRSWT